MSLEEIIARRYSNKTIPKKITFSQEVKRSIFLLICTLFFLIVFLNIAFLQNTSNTTQKGYIWTKAEIDQEALELKKRELTTKNIEAESLSTIENSSIVKKMEQADEKSFIYIE